MTRRLPALFLSLALTGLALAVLGAFLWCENDIAIFVSVGATALMAASAAAPVVTGLLARTAAALAVGSVVGTSAAIVTVLALARSGCVVIG